MRSYFSRSKELIRFACPVAGSMFFNIFSSVIPMLFIARLGKYELAAAALASASFVTLLTLGRGFFNALGIMISHRKGANKEDSSVEVGAIFRNGMLVGLGVGVAILLIMWNMDQFLLFIGQSARLVKLTEGYFHYSGWALLAIMLTQSVRQFYMGIGFPKVSFWMSACGAPLTILLSYFFVFGYGWIPKMALSGVMLAVLITQILTLIVALGMVVFSKYRQEYQLLSSKRWFDVVLCKHMFVLGLPISIQSGAEMIAITATTYFMGWYGANALAAANVVNQYVILFVAFYVGCSQAVSILSSKAYAEKNIALVKEYAVTGCSLMSVLFVLVAVVFLCFPVQLMGFFLKTDHANHHNDIIALGKVFFMIAIAMNYADSIRYVLMGTYRGLQDSKTPMYIGIIGLCVISVSMSYILGRVMHEGAEGVRIGLASGIVCTAIYMLYDFVFGKLAGKLRACDKV